MNKYLLFLFLLLIPTQLGKHWWPEWSLVEGMRVDYLSPTLYLTDIVWLLLLIFNLRPLFYKLKELKFFIFILFVVLVGVNIFMAGNKETAVMGWFRLVQLMITVVIIKNNWKQTIKFLILIIPCWLIGESMLGLAQIVKGGSLQGVFYWLGERRFNLTTIGIAQWSVIGNELIRAYGTFSHPNSMAGFILISLLLWLRYYNFSLKNVVYWMVVWFSVLGLVLSGSRLIWLISVILLVGNYQKIKQINKKAGYLLMIFGVVMMILGLITVNYPLKNFIGGWDLESWTKRVELIKIAGKMIADHWLFGLGVNNFLIELPNYWMESGIRWLQPVHNVLILTVAETGVIQVALFAWIMLNEFKNIRFEKEDLVIFGVIFVTAMADHYWITLPQNRWLLAVLMGIIIGSAKKTVNKHYRPKSR